MIEGRHDSSERLSVGGGYSIMKEGFLDIRNGLHVEGKDLCVLVEIHEEGIAGPSLFSFNYIKRDVAQKVLELMHRLCSLRRVMFTLLAVLSSIFRNLEWVSR